MKDLLKRFELRELRLMLLGIGAVVTAGLVAGLALPKIKTVRAVALEVQVLEEAAQDGGELDRNLQAQHASIEELKYRLHGDMANLPVKQVEAYIIGRLQKVSWNNNVDLVSVEPGTGDRVQIFQEILFNVQLVGQYDDLYRWLLETRSDLGYVVVKEYALTRHDNADDSPQLLAKLSLASYRAVE